MKKYSLTKNKKETLFGTLFQIKAEISFGNVSKGELGGWIEKEDNLSQQGNAWVSGDARVYGNARVSGDARVFGNARVSGDAWVSGNAWVSGDAQVYDNAQVYGDAQVFGKAWVFGNARVSGKLKLTLGYFFGWKEKNEDLTYLDLEDDYQLIAKGEVKTENNDERKTELLNKADELIKKAEELKSEAEKF